jgi:ABC-2 type transport system ATP-binding protein
MRKKIIEVDKLSKRYKKAKDLALDEVSFYVEKGAFFALLGPNGAGKTTTVSILNTTLSKTKGDVIIDGLDIEKDSLEVRKNIGVIFQSPSLDKNLTAEENIRFHVNLYGLYPYRFTFSMMDAKYQKKVIKMAKILGIEQDIHKPIKTFSGGMKRKLEILRSLMHEPKVLFLDEPTTGLDPISRSNLWEYLKDLRKKKNVTIFLTTHYLEEAEDADYACIINRGKVIAKGSPLEIKTQLIERFMIVDAKNRKNLVKEIKKFKVKVKGKGPYKLILNGSQPQEIIQKVSTPLSLLEIHNPTLEQAYVEIIEKDS